MDRLTHRPATSVTIDLAESGVALVRPAGTLTGHECRAPLTPAPPCERSPEAGRIGRIDEAKLERGAKTMKAVAKITAVAVSILCLAWPSAADAGPATGLATGPVVIEPELRDRIREKGRLPVLVRLRAEWAETADSGAGSNPASSVPRTRRAVQAAVLERMSAHDVEPVKLFSHVRGWPWRSTSPPCSISPSIRTSRTSGRISRTPRVSPRAFLRSTRAPRRSTTSRVPGACSRSSIPVWTRITCF